nr:SDR family oxidoreductase [Actinomadura coerulea]
MAGRVAVVTGAGDGIGRGIARRFAAEGARVLVAELEAAADRANPVGRLGAPETDIAPMAVFLASEDARYLTGNTLFADGGSHVNGAAWTPDLDGEQ